MDWNLKIPSWDFTEFEHGTIPDIDSNKGNFSVDLKLGQVIDSGNEFKDSLKNTTNNSKMALSPSSSSKRARPVNTVMCLVDGCKADLSNCKEYHRRHKVCEIHSKTPEVLINCQKQRFCQQCSRFQSLEEFDEGKRSCRKRLDGHNRRRRKPQPDTSRAASLFSGHQGTTMLQFSSPHVYQTTTLTNPLWTNMIKSEPEPAYSTRTHKQNPFPESSSGTKKVTEIQQFNLFHTNGSASGSGSHLKLNHQSSPPKSCQQPQLLTFEANNNNNNNNNNDNNNDNNYEKLLCDGYSPHPAGARAVVPVPPVVQSSDCALSLLSSSPSQTSCTTLTHVISNSFTGTQNQLGAGAGGYGGLESIMDHNGIEMIPMGIHHHHHHHASPDNGVPQTLPFYWE